MILRFLYMAFHYPHPEYRDDLLKAMHGFGATLRAQPGLLEVGNFDDAANGRIIALSIWESVDHFRACKEQVAASLNDVPFDLWEARPRELFAVGEPVASPMDGKG